MGPRAPESPAALGDALLWTIVSLAAWGSFLFLPGRLTSPLRRATALGVHDLANAGSHLHVSIWVWPLADYLYRGVSLGFGRLSDAAVFLPSLLRHDECVASTFCHTVASFRDGLFDATALVGHTLTILGVGGGVSKQGPSFAAMDNRTSEGPGSRSLELGHRHVFLVTQCAALCLWMLAVYWLHTRYALRIRRDPTRDYTPPLVPVCAWMTLWSLAYAACWAFVKGTPILIHTVYPGCVCLLIVYCLIAP